ncbi:MAG: M20/M25/M40 family metallo-hydrolase [Bacteroidales bacterium]|nr:M20/M25/M40 family metallo-hydrolase [Bacteroidales bacterium]
MKLHLSLPALFLLLVSFSACNNQQADSSITIQELKKHEYFLASDSLKGRYPGTPEMDVAANYIRKSFQQAGLILMGKDGYEPFQVVTDIHEGKNNAFSLDGKELILNKDYTPLSFSASKSLDAPVVFAGYGFDISEDSLQWNDYKGLDVKGKWVLVLRGDPDPDNLNSPFARYSRDRDKAMAAMDHGAAGLLLVSGKEFDKKDKLEGLRKIEFSAGIPVFQITRKVADGMFSTGSVATLETKIKRTNKPVGMDLQATVNATASIVTDKKTTRNVLAILKGNDPTLQDEYIVIGAHYDHLGMGGPNTGSRRPDTLAVHYGADDNASGTSLLLELAGKLATEQKHLKRSIVFVAFSAEEMGLLGSKHFVKDSLIDLQKVDAMINLDMIGRMNKDRKLEIGGTGTTPIADSLLKALPLADSLKLVLSPEGYGPSDHASFYAHDIPVFFFSTGTHLDYHTPADTPDKINYKGLKLIGDYVNELVLAIANRPEALQFTKAGPKEGSGFKRRGFKVTLGIMPDYAGQYKNGLRVDLVIPGRPAAAAGMKNGDIIIGMNGKPVKNIYDYMYRLVKLHTGDRVNVEVLRGDEKKILIVQL